MRQILWTLTLATGFAAPLFQWPLYAAAAFVITILWNHLFPFEEHGPEILLLPTKKPYLEALNPMEDPTPVLGEHCPTCWEEIDAESKPTKLACGHVYCNSCILAWIDSGKNTCPICKIVLFRQPMFQGKEAISEKLHKIRICISWTCLITTVVRQILAFVTRHPGGVRPSWQFLNPIFWLTGYGSTYESISNACLCLSDVAQVVVTQYLIEKMGVEWFKGFGQGKWYYWVPTVYFAATNLMKQLDGVSSLWTRVRHIFKWWMVGAPGSYWGWDLVVSLIWRMQTEVVERD
ncbi:FAD/NAD(P)-binding domain-containing protein [Aureobasidium subglaciale]|nr:FAD/NAD(P)-binding domain-containing protein [Aureobasidium subglaciale]